MRCYDIDSWLVQFCVTEDVAEYYKYAVRIVREYPESLKQIIKYIYYPMSLHFCQTMSHIERNMRESVAQLYFGVPELFEQKGNDYIGGSPTVSEVLGMLIDFEYNDNC